MKLLLVVVCFLLSVLSTQVPQRTMAQGLDEITVDLPGLSRHSAPLVLVRIPAGTFTMGSPATEPGHEFNEGPRRQVTISRDFYLGKYEITQAQWKAVMTDNPSIFVGDELPVNKVSWQDCQYFITCLKVMKKDSGFRLPTEAEFEYACRAGTQTATFFGNNPPVEVMTSYAWCRLNSEFEIHPVGMLKPNPWGLYDIIGNVWEWCADWYYLYDSKPTIDPTGPLFGRDKVIRGASWAAREEWLRSADRGKFPPNEAYNTGGFRIVWQEPAS
ncbi:MAG: formylglycine-generating enzyme family protein [bacterium]|jgi:formylglycine-generating enzyme required for sulfatase activity|nr:formylglycine-generating enzyme family protein [bacterium]